MNPKNNLNTMNSVLPASDFANPASDHKRHTAWKRILRMVCLMACVVAALSLVGCGVQVISVTLPETTVMEKGETLALTPEYTAAQETSAENLEKAVAKLNVTWATTDATVASVDESGTVIAMGAGEADVTVTSENPALSTTTHVKVVITPTGIDAPDTLALVMNGENTKNLGASLIPQDATDAKLAYTSSDETVATVDENGNVTAVANGECVITMSVVSDNSVGSKDVAVTVTTDVEKVALDNTEGSLNVGSTYTLTAKVLPDTATDAAITWTSGDESIATVDKNGKIIAVAVGKVTITATAGEKTAAYKLTVQKLQPEKTTTQTSNAAEATTPSAADPAPEPAGPTPAIPSTTPQQSTQCPLDGCQLRADGSCPMESFHWMYTTPTNGYGFSADVLDAWRAASSGPEVKDIYGNPGNVIIPGGGIRDNPPCDICGGEVVIVGPGPTLGCSNGCW